MKRTIHGIACAMVLAALLLASGCEEPTDTAATTTTTVAPPPASDGAAATTPAPAVNTPPVSPPIVTPPATSSGETAPPPVDPTNRVVAKVGVGAKGRYDSNDYVSTVVGSYFGIQQRLAFDQAQRGLNDYKTLQGDYPKTHEQYWKEVIEANSIALPELPDGEEYYYDYEAAKSTRGEEALFVVQPKR